MSNLFKVGDLADHKSGTLDPRPVVEVRGDMIRLDLLGKPMDVMVPAENYDRIPADSPSCCRGAD